MTNFVRKAVKRVVISVVVLMGVALSVHTLSYLNFNSEYGFLKLKQDAIQTGWYLPAYYSHIFVGGIVLVAGFFQFKESIRIRYTKIHRSIGYIYIFGILLFAAPGGMVMAFFIDRGPIVLVSFILQCTLWFHFTLMGFRKVLARQFDEHEKWIMRSYALTLAAITLRLYIFAASYWMDLDNPTAYGIFAWLSWVPNFLFAEAIILKKVHAAA
jgi:hypothetical protein